MRDTHRLKLHLEDHGQDFLWFIVVDNRVEEAGPFQNWLWAGKNILPPKRWQRGSPIDWANGTRLKYRVRRVERLSS